MTVVCLPMIFIAVVLVATGAANGGFLIVAAMCALMMRGMDRSQPDAGMDTRWRTAEDVLAERFARGEIDEQEFDNRLAALRVRQRSTSGT